MLAGIDKIPAIVKENLSDEDAIVYVIETNMIQRSFSELLPSEKAAVLAVRYEKISSQGKFHKHKASYSYHQHGRVDTLWQAVWSVRGHDRWQMNGRKWWEMNGLVNLCLRVRFMGQDIRYTIAKLVKSAKREDRARIETDTNIYKRIKKGKNC